MTRADDRHRRLDRQFRPMLDGGGGRTAAGAVDDRFDIGAETLAVTTVGNGGRADASISSGRCGSATSLAAIWSAAMWMVWPRSCRGRFRRHGAFRFPRIAGAREFIAVKGSVALDGTSLTVNASTATRSRRF